MENYKQTKRFERIVRFAVMFLVVLVCFATFSFVKLGSAKRENERYDELIAQLTKENNELQESIVSSTNTDYLESQARDKLGMIKGDETYIEFQ